MNWPWPVTAQQDQALRVLVASNESITVRNDGTVRVAFDGPDGFVERVMDAQGVLS